MERCCYNVVETTTATRNQTTRATARVYFSATIRSQLEDGQEMHGVLRVLQSGVSCRSESALATKALSTAAGSAAVGETPPSFENITRRVLAAASSFEAAVSERLAEGKIGRAHV